MYFTLCQNVFYIHFYILHCQNVKMTFLHPFLHFDFLKKNSKNAIKNMHYHQLYTRFHSNICLLSGFFGSEVPSVAAWRTWICLEKGGNLTFDCSIYPFYCFSNKWNTFNITHYFWLWPCNKTKETMSYYRIEEVVEEHWLTKVQWMEYPWFSVCLLLDRKILQHVVNLNRS